MYCGLGHGDMRFNVRVLAPADFDAWARAGGREG
jgi:heme/copper-type cytochrome/quinol oxidase subunit 2